MNNVIIVACAASNGGTVMVWTKQGLRPAGREGVVAELMPHEQAQFARRRLEDIDVDNARITRSAPLKYSIIPVSE